MAALPFAANVQIVAPTGADFAPDAPEKVQSLVRAAVGQTGNTPVESSEIKLTTNIMVMGSSYIVVCEQTKDGAVVATGKQKALNLDQLDVAIEGAAAAALANLNTAPVEKSDLVDEAAEPAKEPLPVNTSVVTVEYEEKPADTLEKKRPTRNYSSYGLGISLWHNYDYTADTTNKDDKDVERSWSPALMFHYAKIFEVSPSAAITMTGNLNMVFGSGWELHGVFLLGGRYYIQSGAVSPYFGAGLGVGAQFDNHYAEMDEYLAFGLAGGVEAGIVFFRNSSMQLELGASWDALWDWFSSFDRRFGAGSVYIAINI